VCLAEISSLGRGNAWSISHHARRQMCRNCQMLRGELVARVRSKAWLASSEIVGIGFDLQLVFDWQSSVKPLEGQELCHLL
jgi:hypothetical protein